MKWRPKRTAITLLRYFPGVVSFAALVAALAALFKGYESVMI